MPEIVLAVTIFWGLLLVILGVITMVATIGTDGSDSLFYAAKRNRRPADSACIRYGTNLHVNSPGDASHGTNGSEVQ